MLLIWTTQNNVIFAYIAFDKVTNGQENKKKSVNFSECNWFASSFTEIKFGCDLGYGKTFFLMRIPLLRDGNNHDDLEADLFLPVPMEGEGIYILYIFFFFLRSSIGGGSVCDRF